MKAKVDGGKGGYIMETGWMCCRGMSRREGDFIREKGMYMGGMTQHGGPGREGGSEGGNRYTRERGRHRGRFHM
jgi:hypothetical protein